MTELNVTVHERDVGIGDIIMAETEGRKGVMLNQVDGDAIPVTMPCHDPINIDHTPGLMVK